MLPANLSVMLLFYNSYIFKQFLNYITIYLDVKNKIFPKKNGEVCDLCKEGMGYLEKMLKDPSTISQITEVAGMLCQELPVYKEEVRIIFRAVASLISKCT